MTRLCLLSHAIARGDRTASAVDRLVGGAIHRRRVACEMTHDQLAQATEITRALIADYEAGRKRTPAEHLRRIAHALGAPPAHFFNLPRLQ
ncbi:helix-turn-helix domain-containing protein [Rhodoblastus acidophilus]|uniref:helix-turn-helix domain-containing protein n=1 Tax=Rhodoblastus acidophilus TaxID=1074 RepID=UPI00222561E5|nr:helix-turn-helix transcriptional regulator [Rhodoblastus acidophilus]